MKKSKISISKVQTAFNKAIVRRDKRCMVRGASPCKGGLQCSHFFPVGRNGGLRFYPYNAYAQCAGHHLAHHNSDPAFYHRWLQETNPEELEYMERVRRNPVRYTQQVLSRIVMLCNSDRLEELTIMIKHLIDGEEYD